MPSALQRGDRLVVSELSRLLRSLGPIVTILNALAEAHVSFLAKENIRVAGGRDVLASVMSTLAAPLAEVERDVISERTREDLAQANASGRSSDVRGTSRGVSRLDRKRTKWGRFPRSRRVLDRSLHFHRR